MAKDSLSEVTYLCESGQAVDRSAEGIREFYFELTPGDVDTVFMEAQRQDEVTRRITTVRFNGKEPERGDAGQAYSWLFVKEGK